jgi:hypothetical protein
VRLNDRELRAAYEQSLALTRTLGRLMKERAVERIMDAIRDNDEWATGGPICGAPAGHSTRTHQFAALQESAGICTDRDDPPSRTI